MGRWTVKPLWQFVLLGALLAVVLLQAFPQVNLRDAAFHDGTDPLVIHSQTTSGDLDLTHAVPFQFPVASRDAHSPSWPLLRSGHGATRLPDLIDGSLRC